MIIDLTGVESGSHLKVGEHVVSIFSIEPKETSNGKKYLQIMFKDENGATVNSNFFTTTEALWRLKKLATCAGITIPQLDTDLLLGELVKIKVVKKEENGKTYFNVDSIFPAPKKQDGLFNGQIGHSIPSPFDACAPNDEDEPF